jgi:hypothetical protein
MSAVAPKAAQHRRLPCIFILLCIDVRVFLLPLPSSPPPRRVQTYISQMNNRIQAQLRERNPWDFRYVHNLENVRGAALLCCRCHGCVVPVSCVARRLWVVHYPAVLCCRCLDACLQCGSFAAVMWCVVAVGCF